MVTIYGGLKNVLSTKQCILKKIKYLYFCVTGLPSSISNRTKSQSNCKTPNLMENHATDLCELSEDTTTEIGMWTNIFRVETSTHVDHGNTFCNNKQIYLFILQ